MLFNDLPCYEVSVSLFCLLLVESIIRDQTVPITQWGHRLCPVNRMHMERTRCHLPGERRGHDRLYDFRHPYEIPVTTCMKSFCFLTCNSNFVPFYKGVFRYTDTVLLTWEIENYSFIRSGFRVIKRLLTPQFFLMYVFNRKGCLGIHTI